MRDAGGVSFGALPGESPEERSRIGSDLIRRAPAFLKVSPGAERDLHLWIDRLPRHHDPTSGVAVDDSLQPFLHALGDVLAIPDDDVPVLEVMNEEAFRELDFVVARRS